MVQKTIEFILNKNILSLGIRNFSLGYDIDEESNIEDILPESYRLKTWASFFSECEDIDYLWKYYRSKIRNEILKSKSQITSIREVETQEDIKNVFLVKNENKKEMGYH